jgi:hypothetical protein
MPNSPATSTLLTLDQKTSATSMNAKWKVLGLTAAIVSVVVGLLWNRHSAPIAKPEPETTVVPVAKAPPAPPLPPEENIVPPAAPVRKTIVQSAPKPEPVPQSQNQKPAKEPLHDPDARDALALVGADPAAEQYWLEAIYDTSLPDKEREDLMEDLNEVGFADPDNVTADDLPLIANRLQIIEGLLPYTDDFMRGHLLEAGKDLSAMADKVKY